MARGEVPSPSIGEQQGRFMRVLGTGIAIPKLNVAGSSPVSRFWPCAVGAWTARAGVAGARPAIEASADRLDAALQDASDRGVTAVPTFVVNGQWSIPGAQDVGTFERILRRLSA